MFSDEDLKRLKEYSLTEITLANYISKDVIGDLLARLEAAERVAERFQDNTPEDTALFNAWRRSAGKDSL